MESTSIVDDSDEEEEDDDDEDDDEFYERDDTGVGYDYDDGKSSSTEEGTSVSRQFVNRKHRRRGRNGRYHSKANGHHHRRHGDMSSRVSLEEAGACFMVKLWI